jgi:hypothetical protein
MRPLIPALILAALLAPAAALAAPEVTPGEWQSTTIIDSMTMPGVPANALDMMKGRPTTITYCLTPEQAEADPEKMFARDDSCQIDNFEITSSTINTAMTCKGPQGPATITMTGTHDGTSYTMASTMKSGPMTMISRTTGKRLGPCK